MCLGRQQPLERRSCAARAESTAVLVDSQNALAVGRITVRPLQREPYSSHRRAVSRLSVSSCGPRLDTPGIESVQIGTAGRISEAVGFVHGHRRPSTTPFFFSSPDSAVRRGQRLSALLWNRHVNAKRPVTDRDISDPFVVAWPGAGLAERRRWRSDRRSISCSGERVLPVAEWPSDADFPDSSCSVSVRRLRAPSDG